MPTKLVPWVSAVELRLLDCRPPMLRVVAHGSVPTGGWRSGRLSPHVYAHAPTDGVWGYDFVADVDPGSGDDGIASIEASHIIEALPNGFHGVRIFAGDSSRVAMIGSHTTEHVRARDPMTL